MEPETETLLPSRPESYVDQARRKLTRETIEQRNLRREASELAYGKRGTLGRSRMKRKDKFDLWPRLCAAYKSMEEDPPKHIRMWCAANEERDNEEEDISSLEGGTAKRKSRKHTKRRRTKSRHTKRRRTRK